MTTERKSLEVPYIPELDNMDMEQVIATLDEKGARRTVDCLNWKEEFPYHPLTAFSIAHSGTHIYIDFFVRCNYLRAVNDKNNSDVYKDSCVEFFVAPEGTAPYYNFEFNCIGTTHVGRRMDRHNATLLSDAEIDRIKRLPSCGTRPFEELEGIFSWNLAVAIPLDLMGVEYHPGTPVTLKGNFYKCADATSEPHYLSWSPIDTPHPDFHRPEFFGDITLL
ncbi:MAG: hypothetical protein HDS57_03670 [Barnesiella sp.]|nr:hypothetical protein [Barnesiella sp.]